MKRRGLVYEARVMETLKSLDSEGLIGIDHPWLEFETHSGQVRLVQPDWLGINVRTASLLIVEVKLTRVAEAWWQLNRLYKPVVERIFPEWEIALLEITSTIQHVQVPEEIPVVRRVLDAQVGRTSLMKVPYDC